MAIMPIDGKNTLKNLLQSQAVNKSETCLKAPETRGLSSFLGWPITFMWKDQMIMLCIYMEKILKCQIFKNYGRLMYDLHRYCSNQEHEHIIVKVIRCSLKWVPGSYEFTFWMILSESPGLISTIFHLKLPNTLGAVEMVLICCLREPFKFVHYPRLTFDLSVQGFRLTFICIYLRRILTIWIFKKIYWSLM